MAEQAFGPPSSRPAMTLQLLIQNRSSRPTWPCPKTHPVRLAAIREATAGIRPDGLREATTPKRGLPAARGAPDAMFEDRRGFPRGFRAPGGLYRGFPAIAPGPLSDASPLAGVAGERGAGPLLVPDFPCWA